MAPRFATVSVSPERLTDSHKLRRLGGFDRDPRCFDPIHAKYVEAAVGMTEFPIHCVRFSRTLSPRRLNRRNAEPDYLSSRARNVPLASPWS
jgi:hypothetical protein